MANTESPSETIPYTETKSPDEIKSNPPLEVGSEAEVAPYHPRMNPNKPGKLNFGRTFLLGLAFLSAQCAWAYYNFMMPLLLRDFTSQWALGGWFGQDAFIGLIMVMDNVVAVFAIPYFGYLSDRTQSRYGKRTPFILIGGSIGLICFSLIPNMHIFGALFGVIMAFNLGMAFYRSCAATLMPDMTPNSVRSLGNSLIQIMGALAFVLGMSASVVMGLFFDVSIEEEKIAARMWGFYYVSFVMLIALIILFLTIKETPTGTKFMQFGKHPIAIDPLTFEYIGEIPSLAEIHSDKDPTARKGPFRGILRYIDIVFRGKDRNAMLMMIAIFFSFFGFNALETYYSSYAIEYLGWKDSDASLALMMAPIAMVIFAVPIGWISDRLGRKPMTIIGFLGLSVCVEILHETEDFAGSGFIVSVITIMAAGIFSALISINAIILVWQIAPKERVGEYTGTYYFFSQTAAILSPVVMGILFDLYVKLNPGKIAFYGQGYQYRMLFIFILFWQIVAVIITFFVKVPKSAKLSKEELKKLRESLDTD